MNEFRIRITPIRRILVRKLALGKKAAVCLMSVAVGFAQKQPQVAAQSQSNLVPSTPTQKEAPMTMHAKGSFDVKVIPQKPDNKEAEAANLTRISLDKQFHGELEATSKGEMLTSGVANGSGGYVALERVIGTLHGRNGTFVLQHLATMTRGVPQMSIMVVPDSGTEELAGIAGTMTIKIEDGGKHYYEFGYTLPEAR